MSHQVGMFFSNAPAKNRPNQLVAPMQHNFNMTAIMHAKVNKPCRSCGG